MPTRHTSDVNAVVEHLLMQMTADEYAAYADDMRRGINRRAELVAEAEDLLAQGVDADLIAAVSEF